MRKLILYTIAIVAASFAANNATAQCTVDIYPAVTSVACGDTVDLESEGSGGQVQLGDDFDSGGFAPGWNSTVGPTFTNPCGAGPGGATNAHMWMGTGFASNREVETVDYDLSCGGQICFDLRLEQQGGGAPCEGPDQPNEGVYLEFSTNNGTTWNTIYYFNPDTNNSNGGASSPLINWNNFCFNIPPAAQTTSTRIRWFQINTSGSNFDHWGIDNVFITTNCGAPFQNNWYTVDTAVTPAVTTFLENDTTDSGFFDTVQYNTTDYMVMYFNDVDTCFDTVQILTTPTPIEITANDTIICSNEIAQLTVSGGNSWTWSSLPGGDTINVPTNFSCATCEVTDATPSVTTDYVVESDLTGLCHEKDTITISVPTIDAGPDTTICEGDTILMQPNLTSSTCGGLPTYSWAPTTGVSNPGIINPTITTAQTRTYFLTYNDGCGCVLTDSVTITVNNMQEPTRLLNAPSCGIADGQYTVQNVGGNAPFLYSIDNGNTFQVSPIFNGIDVGVYNLQIQDAIGCFSPVNLDTVINPNAPVIDSIAETDLSCFQAQDGILEVFTTGGTAPIAHAIDSVTFFPTNQFTGLTDGNYTVVAQDANGCISLPELATLEPNAQIVFDSTTITNVDCFGANTGEIVVHGHGGTPPLSYSINNGNTFQSSTVFDSLVADDYFIVIQDSKGCDIPATYRVVSQPSDADIDLIVNNDTCFQACGGSASVQVSGATAPYSYNWNGAGGNSNITSNLCAGNNYLFTLTDAAGCTFDTSFIVTEPAQLVVDSIDTENNTCNGSDDGTIIVYPSGGTPPYSYSINGGANFQASPQFNSLTIGTYNIAVKDANGCSTSSQAIISEPTAVTISASSNYEKICVSNCVNVAAPASGGNGGPYIHYWNNGLDSNATQSVCPDENTVYTVYAEDINGCGSNVELIEVELYDSLDVDAGPNLEICPGESVDLSVIADGGDGNGYRYNWSPATGLSSAFISNPTATPTTTTDYVITLRDNCGSPAVTDVVRVIVNPLPQVDFFSLDSLEGCEPLDITLKNNTSPAQFAEWRIGRTARASGFTADITDLKAGSYDVNLKITTPAGCTDELLKTNYIVVHPKPKADFMPSPQPTTTFDTRITFTDQSIGDIIDWNWDFAGFGNSADENPEFEFPADTGEYDVDLRVTTRKMCVNDTTIKVRIGAEFNMYFPNSFTPNGDGLNDVFAPVGIGIDPDQYSMLIFNRWGELVFETETLSTPWDGSLQNTNSMAPEGSYVVKVVANDYTDEADRNEYVFYVNLIR